MKCLRCTDTKERWRCEWSDDPALEDAMPCICPCHYEDDEPESGR